jgi:23S rRNA pseudouridine1911/1915/1917 synthase
MGETYVATGGRLDAVVASLAHVPRAAAQRAIADGRVEVDGRARPRAFRLTGGETLWVDLPAEEALRPGGDPVPIRFRDEHLAVVAKPAGVLTHPTTAERDVTLVNRLLGMGVPLAPAGGPRRPGIVHRLDRGTSGLLVVASTDEAFQGLRSMFRRHTVDRRYLALVRGLTTYEDFGVDAPLGRRAARVVVDHVGGRASATAFVVRDRLPATTLLEAAPATGRTHQIRVHLRAVGHPIVGDRRYGGAGELASSLGLERPFLHSWRIDLEHPVTGERVQIEEPLPADLAEALGRARDDLRP